jgi:hypothetical protein
MTTLLDPTSEVAPVHRERAVRLDNIAGATIGLLDISKPRGDVFLDTVEELLQARGAHVIRYQKPAFSKPASADLRHLIATQCHAVIEALAD